MNVKDLMTNEELANLITEDIADLKQDAKVTYEVWTLGYNADNTIANSETLLKAFTDPDKAVDYANQISAADLNKNETSDKISIEVETVVDLEDGEGTMNVGTVYRRDLWIDGEYGSEEDIEDIEDIEYPIVNLTEQDYELLSDGTLKVKRSLLKDYNKNDYFKVMFVGEHNHPIIYKIVSKVVYDDGDYFHCEFAY